MNDATLRIPRDRLKEELTKQYTEITPWGQFTIIENSKKYVIKKIIINPGQELSIHYHNFRNENLTVIFGEGEVFLQGKWSIVGNVQHYFINVREQHSIKNTSERWPLILIEVQTGQICKECDIVRLSDRYHRV